MREEATIGVVAGREVPLPIDHVDLFETALPIEKGETPLDLLPPPHVDPFEPLIPIEAFQFCTGRTAEFTGAVIQDGHAP